MNAHPRAQPARMAAGLAALTLLAGCPFAQPVPGVEHQDGGTITPPRVDTTSAQPATTTVLFRPDCGAQYSLQANVIDENLTDTVQTRWYVDYDASIESQRGYVWHQDFGPPPEDPTPAVRVIPVTWPFKPDGWKGTSLAPKHVVELVISNGFASDNDRAPGPGYETQVFRWVFLDSSSAPCSQ